MHEMINKRTGVGAAIGTIVGFMLGGPIGGAVGAVVGGGIAHAAPQPQKGIITPKRKIVFETAMVSMKSPDDLRALADVFDQEGLGGHADLLRKRAGLRELPETTKNLRRDAYRRGMCSNNPDGIEEVSKAFAEEGAIAAAQSLRDHAEGVRAVQAAGRSGKPVDDKTLHLFADRMAKAVMQYGPESAEAKMAAANFVNARGLTVSDKAVADAIVIAQSELHVNAASPIDEAHPSESIPPEAAEAAAAASTTTPVEPPKPEFIVPPPDQPKTIDEPHEPQMSPAAPPTATDPSAVTAIVTEQAAVNAEIVK